MDEVLNSYYLFGLEVLQNRLPALTRELEGVRAADDLEYVHRMRVASRRMRNALALFGAELPRKYYAEWTHELYSGPVKAISSPGLPPTLLAMT
jgi:CHAD domain-containing protein